MIIVCGCVCMCVFLCISYSPFFKETPAEAAARECAEETMGVLGTKEYLLKSLRDYQRNNVFKVSTVAHGHRNRRKRTESMCVCERERERNRKRDFQHFCWL